jgi:SAM-dependent methyltransferase
MIDTCRLCKGTDLEPMIDLGRRPIAHRLLESRDEAEDTYPMALHFCLDCGLIQVLDTIEPEILYTDFNYNFSAWKPEPHLEDEIDAIMAQGPFASAVEFGCNDGTFLKALADRGIPVCVGIEPNPVSGSMARDKSLSVFQSWVNEDVCEKIVAEHGELDLVLSRQVIEHVPDLDNFVSCIKRMLKEDGVLFLDMPDFEPSLLVGDCSAVWEEHVSYFTEPILRKLLARHGLEITEVRKYDFSSGCLAVIARTTEKVKIADDGETRRVMDLAAAFGGAVRGFEAGLRDGLSQARERGVEVALYGVGVRGCCTLNGLDLSGLVDYAVDDQPERQGKFMPGCRLEIRPSSVLGEGRGPVICLLAVNNENEDKVEAKVREAVDRPLTFVTLCSPKDINAALAELDRAGDAS